MYLHYKMSWFAKILSLVVLLAASGSVARAESMTLEQVDGTVFNDVRIKRSEPTSISFRYTDGFATIPSGSLTDESLSKLGLDPANNPEFKAQREEMALKENLRTLKKNRATIPGGVGTGQTIQTKDITDINPITILVTEGGVPRRIELAILTKEIQQELGYDAAKAAEYTKAKKLAEDEAAKQAGILKAQQLKLDAEAAKKRADAEKKAAADAAKAKPKTTDDSNRFNALPPTK